MMILSMTGEDTDVRSKKCNKKIRKDYVETLTAKKILSGDVHAGDTIVLDVKDGEFTVSTK